MAKILLVEDDPEISAKVAEWLVSQHHRVEAITDGNEAQQMLKLASYDMVILDWNLPGMSGLEILKDFRNHGGVTPVLMLTAKDQVADIEAGLYTGADDYLTKPFDMRELAARVTALTRRRKKNYDPVLRTKSLELNSDTHKVMRNGEEVHLQPQEFALLEFLLRNSNEIFSVDALLQRVWPSDTEASADTVRVCITRLRNKIDSTGGNSLIKTVHRMGYQIDNEE